MRIITWEEYFTHDKPHDCWVLINGLIYNVSDYLVEHPGGHDILLAYSGYDGTDKFNSVPHSSYAINLRDGRIVGKIETPTPTPKQQEELGQRKKKKEKKTTKVREEIEMREIATHKSEESCWVIVSGNVYDVTTYLNEHPGGVSNIMTYGGKDATKAFKQANHSANAIRVREGFYIGTMKPESSHLGLFILAIVAIVAMLFLAGKYFLS